MLISPFPSCWLIWSRQFSMYPPITYLTPRYVLLKLSDCYLKFDQVHSFKGTDEVDHRTYIAAEPLDFPSLSPPPYKTPSSAGSSSTSNGGQHVTGNTMGGSSRHGNGGCTNIFDDKKSSTLLSKKYHKSNQTDSSTSLASQSKIDAACSSNVAKRTSVVFEEPRAPTITTITSQSSSSTAPTTGNLTRVAMATSKQVNGILRKGSVPGDDIVPSAVPVAPPQPPNQLNLNLSPQGKVQQQQQQQQQQKSAFKNNNNERETSQEPPERQHSSRKTKKNKEKASSNKSGKSRDQYYKKLFCLTIPITYFKARFGAFPRFELSLCSIPLH